MSRWLRFEHGGKAGFGTLEGDTVMVYERNLFGQLRR